MTRDTTLEAFQHGITSGKFQGDAARILAFVKLQGGRGATADEAGAYLNIPHPADASRMTELSAAGDVVRTEERRRTRAGRAAAVYVAREFYTEKQVELF
jgi:predicted ArsR family transcriptional regulator